MKLDGTPFTNSDTCKGVSFGVSGAPLDIARIEISGRYPEQGWATNEVSTEMVVVNSGEGQLLLKEGGSIAISVGDSVTVAPNQWFAWKGSMELTMSCAPAFDPAQYKVVVS